MNKLTVLMLRGIEASTVSHARSGEMWFSAGHSGTKAHSKAPVGQSGQLTS
ncbi:MAG: hypothetical protein GY922_06910 [Proteobacteria bacterium]|nr:hypothetical protein [Pseudomonadota bacterium]